MLLFVIFYIFVQMFVKMFWLNQKQNDVSLTFGLNLK